MRPSRNPRAAQEAPKELQRPEKNLPKKIPKNAIVVKNALSWRSHLRHFWEPILVAKFAMFCHHLSTFCWSLFGELLEPILEPILRPDRPKRGQDEPNRTIKSFKEPKTFIYKNLKKPLGFFKVFGYRGLSRKPQEAQDGSQKAPKTSKTPKIGIQNWDQKL